MTIILKSPTPSLKTTNDVAILYAPAAGLFRSSSARGSPLPHSLALPTSAHDGSATANNTTPLSATSYASALRWVESDDVDSQRHRGQLGSARDEGLECRRTGVAQRQKAVRQDAKAGRDECASESCGAWRAGRPTASARMCRWARWDEDANANAGCEKEEEMRQMSRQSGEGLKMP